MLSSSIAHKCLMSTPFRTIWSPACQGTFYYESTRTHLGRRALSVVLMPVAPPGVKIGYWLVKHTEGHIYYGLIGFSLVVLGAVLLWQVLQHRLNPFSLNQVKEFEGRTAWFLVAHLPFLNRGQTDIQRGSEDSLADMSLFAQ